MNAGKHNYIRLGRRGFTRQKQGVTDNIGNGVEDLRGLVIMGEDDRVTLFLQAQDCIDIAGEHRPLYRRDHAFDPFVDRGRPGDNVGVEAKR